MGRIERSAQSDADIYEIYLYIARDNDIPVEGGIELVRVVHGMRELNRLFPRTWRASGACVV